MGAYPKVKRVDATWLGTIPEHWEWKRIKRVFAERKERNNPVITTNILSLTASQGVIPYAERDSISGNKPKTDMTEYNIARENDLLVNCMNVILGSAGVSRYAGAISPVYYALYTRDNHNVWYFHYLFRLTTFQQCLIGLGKGILAHRMRISMDYLGNVSIPVPPRSEQDQIVRYLDWQVSRIDKLIEGKKREIELLKEQKLSTVSYYTTHSKHDSVNTSSSIYWLKDIPVSWRVTSLKHILTKEKRPTLTNADLLICSNSGDVVKRGDTKLGLVASSDEIYQGVARGDLLIHGMDTWHGAIAISNYDGMCTPVVHVCQCKEEKRFVAYYLKMMAYTKVFKAISNGVRQNTSDFRSWDKVGELLICLPPIEEQREIADYIDKLIGQINKAIESLMREITLMEEFKTRLISDVVTGKIDVCNGPC